MSADDQGGWLLKQRAHIRTWRRFWAQAFVKDSRATLRFASSPEAALQSKFDKEEDITGYVLRGDAAKAG